MNMKKMDILITGVGGQGVEDGVAAVFGHDVGALLDRGAGLDFGSTWLLP